MTSETMQQSEAALPSAQGSDSASLHSGTEALFAQHRPKRTLGLRVFDATFYGGVVNTAILLASAASTYWTYHGNTVGKPGGWLRWVGEGFHKRRQPIENALSKVGVTGEAAKIGTTVFWSFFDGTLFAPLIKLIEDRREKIALAIDTLFGTKADDMRAYDAEPKQGWKSVLAGRAETLGIVLPVAIIMEKTGGNKKIFYDGGEKIMAAVEAKTPKLDKRITSLVSAPNTPEFADQLTTRKKTFFHVLTFEAFYTTICTIGTYLFSRGFARKHTPKDAVPHAHSHATNAKDSAEIPAVDQPLDASKPEHLSTTAEPATKVAGPRTNKGKLAAANQEQSQGAA